MYSRVSIWYLRGHIIDKQPISSADIRANDELDKKNGKDIFFYLLKLERQFQQVKMAVTNNGLVSTAVSIVVRPPAIKETLTCTEQHRMIP